MHQKLSRRKLSRACQQLLGTLTRRTPHITTTKKTTNYHQNQDEDEDENENQNQHQNDNQSQNQNDNLFIDMSHSIHSLLTHSALVTLAQLAPPQLLNSFQLMNPPDTVEQTKHPPDPTTPPTTIEQLSASSIPLPITSVSSIWRLLNCIEWINHRAIQEDSNNNYYQLFDVSSTLQNVGDILSSISSESDVEMVFYQVCYPPRPEAPELQAFNSSRDHDLPPSSTSTPHYTSSSDSRTSNEPSNLFLGTDVDGEGDLRQVLVRADEKGLITGLICLLRQILCRAKPSSTIEVGLHLTPLHPTQPNPETSAQDPVPHSLCTSWKCVFDVSLTTPASLPSSTPTQQDGPTADQYLLNPELTSITSSEPTRSGRLRISSNQNSELPICPEESLSKIIFEKFLGMKLSTGRLTSSGHSWKVTGILEKSSSAQDSDVASGHSLPTPSQASSASLPFSFVPTSEPTVEELTKFAETALKGKKAVFFAAEQSTFAKHITTYLTSWNIDVSHMPYERVQVESPNSSNPSADPDSNTITDGTRKISATLLEPPGPTTSSNPTPSDPNKTTSMRPNNFIIIDDHISTLKTQLVKLRASTTISNLLMPAHSLTRNPQTSQRPPLSRRMKSLTQIDRFEGIPKPCHTSFIYFTSILNFRKVQDVIRNHLAGAQWTSIPDVLVIPKPIGHRRILTALHTALSRPLTEPQVIPIATSPSSPGTPHYFSAHSHPLSTSQLGRVRSCSNYRDANDFENAIPNHPTDDANNSVVENLNPTWPAPVQNTTPPGLRTPGTTPGTPGVPSPALLSHEALEYFSKAATENGGSSSTGVVLQSPDGRPQAMFFHHSGSSNRPKNEVAGHLDLTGSSNGRSSHGKLRSGSRSSSLNRPVMREFVGVDSDALPMTLAQQVMANARDTATRGQLPTSNPNISNTRSSDSSPSRSADKNPLNQTVRSSNPRNNHVLGHPPPDTVFPHAMALAQYEAISPKTPTLTFPEGLYVSSSSQRRANSVSSSQSMVLTPTHSDHSTTPITPNVSSQTYTGLSPLTKEQQQILLNPRPLPMLRMPSVPVSLPRSISVTLPSPRLPAVSKLTPTTEILPEPRSRSHDSPPSCFPSHHNGDETKPPLDRSPINSEPPSRNIAMTKSTSAVLEANRRRASMGEPIVAISRLGSKRRISRKPTTALVPPINVLIVEDNRINQTILTTFMRKKSVKFDVAMNGQEAVDKWRNGSFHLVLMDLQLPVKDGIEATKEIREAERAANINAFANTPPAVGGNTPPALLGSSGGSRATPHNVSVIIVALTASSLDVDREVALAAGCNDFLTKPVSLAWLEKKLLEWGSMAWLSGFSRPKILSSNNNAASLLLNQSSPATFSPNAIGFDASLAPPLPPPPSSSLSPVSFTGTLAQRKAKQVADHLHLRSDKVRAAEDRKRANLNKGKGVLLNDEAEAVTSSSAQNSLGLGTTTVVAPSSTVEEMYQKTPSSKTKTSQDNDGCGGGSSEDESSKKVSNLIEDQEDTSYSNRSSNSSLLQPKISLQIPTPERHNSSCFDNNNHQVCLDDDGSDDEEHEIPS